jgi:hypothetical protein
MRSAPTPLPARLCPDGAADHACDLPRGGRWVAVFGVHCEFEDDVGEGFGPEQGAGIPQDLGGVFGELWAMGAVSLSAADIAGLDDGEGSGAN